MMKRIRFIEGVEVEVDATERAIPPSDSAADKAGVRSFVRAAASQAEASLADSMAVLGHVASAFSKSLAASDHKPNLVEISFGLEASGEAGNFIVSKIGGKANFSVKMTWKPEG